MLFNLEEDISEKNNQVETQKDVAKQLSDEISNWEKQLIDPVFLGLSQDSLYNSLHPDRFKNPGK